MNDPYIVIGSLGAFLLLVAFTLLNLRRVERDSYLYQALNLVAAVLLLVYAVLLGSYPFIALNAVWASVALYGTVRLRAGVSKN